MTNQDKWLLGLRLIMLACIVTLAAMTVNLVASPGVRAPLLTMMGGVTIVMTLYPPRVMTVLGIAQDIIAVAGTGIAIAGAFYWLTDAAQKATVNDFLLSYSLARLLFLLLGLYGFLTIPILSDSSGLWKAIKTAIRRIIRR